MNNERVSAQDLQTVLGEVLASTPGLALLSGARWQVAALRH